MDAMMNAAIAAIVEAGSEIMEIYGREFDVKEKADRSPVTEADRRAHTLIEQHLSAELPRMPLMSEEGAEQLYTVRAGWERYWLIDPLDGTKEFIKKNDEFTVNIALMQADSCELGKPSTASPVAGLVYLPATAHLFVGVVGRGAWRATVAPGSAQPALEDIINHGTALPDENQLRDRAYTVVASRSHMSPETEEYIERVRIDHPDLETISAGSSLKICRVAEGAADEYPRFGPTMEWDTAAGDAVARASGCGVLAWDPVGKTAAGKLQYNKHDLHNPWFLVQR